MWRAILIGALVTSLLGLPAGVASAAACATEGSGGDWPVFQHDVTASGNQSEESTIDAGNVGDLEPAWVAPVAGTVESPAVVSGGCVFIGTQGGNVSAFDVEDGSLVWGTELGTATTLSVANGRVFVQSGGTLSALGVSTGEILWQTTFPAGPGYGSIGSPLAFGDFVVAGSSGSSDRDTRSQIGHYAIFDQATGEAVAHGFDTSIDDHARGMEGSGFWSHPSYDPEEKYIYFGTAEPRSVAPENPLANALVKIDADPGRPTFGKIVGHFRVEPLNGQVANIPVVGPALCGPELDAGPACFDDHDWSSTAIIFSDSSGRKLIGSATPSIEPLPRTGGPLLGSPRGNFYAIDPDVPPSERFEGNRMRSVWSAPTSGARAAVAAYDESTIYYPSGFDGQIIAVDKDTGAIMWETATLGPNAFQHVSVANGVVYSPGGVGMLMAFDARDGSPLLQRALAQDIGTLSTGTLASGVTIARNTVFIPTNSTPVTNATDFLLPDIAPSSAYLVAYRLPS